MDDDRIELEGLAVPRSLLDAPGSSLPTTWAGRPLLIELGSEFTSEGTVVPTDGWRQLAGAAEGIENDPRWGAVIAAPAADGSGRWLLMHLKETSRGWTGWLPWSSTPRPGQLARRRGLRVAWPEGDLTATASGLLRLQVTLSRVDGGAIAWDPRDDLDVVGWVQDVTTGDSLPFSPWHTATGRGDAPASDVASIDLPVTWLTDGIHRLVPGTYQISATVVSLNLHTKPRRLSLRST